MSFVILIQCLVKLRFILLLYNYKYKGNMMKL